MALWRRRLDQGWAVRQEVDMEEEMVFNVVVSVEVYGMITEMDETEARNGMILAEVDMAEEVDVVEDVVTGRPQFPWANGDAASRFHTTVAHRMGGAEGEEMVIENPATQSITRR